MCVCVCADYKQTWEIIIAPLSCNCFCAMSARAAHTQIPAARWLSHPTRARRNQIKCPICFRATLLARRQQAAANSNESEASRVFLARATSTGHTSRENSIGPAESERASERRRQSNRRLINGVSCVLELDPLFKRSRVLPLFCLSLRTHAPGGIQADHWSRLMVTSPRCTCESRSIHAFGRRTRVGTFCEHGAKRANVQMRPKQLTIASSE